MFLYIIRRYALSMQLTLIWSLESGVWSGVVVSAEWSAHTAQGFSSQPHSNLLLPGMGGGGGDIQGENTSLASAS